jgi:hypothetical protein
MTRADMDVSSFGTSKIEFRLEPWGAKDIRDCRDDTPGVSLLRQQSLSKP